MVAAPEIVHCSGGEPLTTLFDLSGPGIEPGPLAPIAMSLTTATGSIF